MFLVLQLLIIGIFVLADACVVSLYTGG